MALLPSIFLSSGGILVGAVLAGLIAAWVGERPDRERNRLGGRHSDLATGMPLTFFTGMVIQRPVFKLRVTWSTSRSWGRQVWASCLFSTRWTIRRRARRTTMSSTNDHGFRASGSVLESFSNGATIRGPEHGYLLLHRSLCVCHVVESPGGTHASRCSRFPRPRLVTQKLVHVHGILQLWMQDLLPVVASYPFATRTSSSSRVAQKPARRMRWAFSAMLSCAIARAAFMNDP